jgi:hypothetical protein
MSSALKTSSCRLPSRRNEDLVTGGDVVLAFDRVVKQEGREFLTSSWRSDQAVCLRERAVYIDCPGRLNAKPLNQVVWVLSKNGMSW